MSIAKRAAAIVLGPIVAGLIGIGVAHAQSTPCTGNRVVQQAPYSCTVTKTISGMTFTVHLDLDVAGTAVVTFDMSPVQATDVPVVVRSYTGISGAPSKEVTGVVAAGQTTARLVMAPVECGQLDIKAVHTARGDTRGRLAGPVVSWGTSCQPAPPPTTSAPPITPAPVPPEATIISAVPVTTAAPLPATGSDLPWRLALGLIATAGVLILVSRRTTEKT
jgi:LPXTG-motif cell wall-anchored protein